MEIPSSRAVVRLSSSSMSSLSTLLVVSNFEYRSHLLIFEFVVHRSISHFAVQTKREPKDLLGVHEKGPSCHKS